MEGFFDLTSVVDLLGFALHKKITRVYIIEGTASLLAVAVDESAASQREDERIERGLRFIAGRGFVEFDECFLGEVFGVGSVACGTVKEIDESRLPTLDQLSEGDLVAFSNPSQACAVDVFRWRGRASREGFLHRPET